MSKKDEALKLALVAERVLKAWDDPQGMPALCEEMNSLREALAEQPAQQEPVAWRFRSGTWFNREVHWRYIDTLDGAEGLRGLQPLYTSPSASKPWVGLTLEERQACTQSPFTSENYLAIEAKLREKNT